MQVYDYFKHRFPESGSQDSLLKLEAAGYGTNTLLPIRVGYPVFFIKMLRFYMEKQACLFYTDLHYSNVLT